MSRSAVRARPGQDRTSLYEEITNKIIAELEAGRLPWVQPWGSSGVSAPLAMPKNAATGRGYSGINVLILWGAVVQHGFPTQSWLTFRQALGLGGNVRKGERGTTVVYADRFVPDDERRRSRETGDEAVAIPFLKRFTVFNAAQCDGLPDDLVAVPPPVPEGLIMPEVEALIRASGADLRLGGDKCLLRAGARLHPGAPARELLRADQLASHGAARARSLDRPCLTARAGSLWRFGSKLYSREELVAEMTSAFCCATLGIVPTVRHADYIGAWLEVLLEDNRAVIRAASAVSKAADFLLAFRTGVTDAGIQSEETA
jgi:antirestriction protein ArdC